MKISLLWINMLVLSLCLGAGLCILIRKKTREIAVSYDINITKIPVQTLKNLRYYTPTEKKQLFETFSAITSFSVENCCLRIKSIPNPDVILWFTNHYGDISYAGLEWYKKHIFTCTPLNTTFWLTDLAAWRWLSLSQQELCVFNDFTEFTQKQEARKGLELSNCSLIHDASLVLLSTIEQCNRYKVLKSYDFFRWLLDLPGSIHSLNPFIVDDIVRKDIRPNAAHFNLKEIGYTPVFLNYCLPNLKKNLLDLDQTQIFPLLQYLEALYYALTIINTRLEEGKSECQIIFLLPNKEFTYYLVSNEKKPFDTFAKHLEQLLRNQKMKNNIKITLHIYPFRYGSDFYDQPYEQPAPFIKTTDEIYKLLITQ